MSLRAFAVVKTSVYDLAILSVLTVAQTGVRNVYMLFAVCVHKNVREGWRSNDVERAERPSELRTTEFSKRFL